MNKKTKIVLVVLVLVIVAIIIWRLNQEDKPEIVGASCGTVSPDARDQCCYRQYKDNNNFPTCENSRISFNLETQECETTCNSTEQILCTEDALECEDGTFTSRTPILNCQFIPCGYE